jgi:hypothetical protein
MNKKHAGLVLLSLGLCGLLAAGAAEVRAQGSTFKNLQVLPKDIDKPTLKQIMKKQAKALGVECEFCHEQPDMAKDTDHKKIGREMMRLVEAINKGADFKPVSKDARKAQEYYNKKLTGKKDIECNTCHQGKEKPAEK